MLFSCLPAHLEDHLKAGRKFLVCTDQQTWLADASAVFERDGEGPMQFVIVDLEDLWGKFQQIVGDRGELSEVDMMQLCRIDQTILRIWQGKGMVAPINATYDWRDGFAAVVCSVLRRRGVNMASTA
jgi:hypothetical protein